MTAEDLLAWRKRLGLNQSEAAKKLGVDRKTLRHYETGQYPIPKYIGLAAAAISLGINHLPVQQGA